MQDWPLSVTIIESQYLFPFLEGLHLLTVTVSVGFLMFLDLRLLGLVFRRLSVTEIVGRLHPWTLAAFSVMTASGALLFVSQAVKAWHSGWFRMKMALLILAGLNALYFHLRLYPKRAQWDDSAPAPGSVRFVAAASLALWTLVICAGRMMAYHI